jgi:hypothetical protein
LVRLQVECLIDPFATSPRWNPLVEPGLKLYLSCR